MPTPDHSRRAFLESLGIGTAGLVVGGFTARAGGYQANESLGIGVIGCGGRARGRLMTALKRLPGIRITAVCDVYDAHLQAGKVVAGSDAFTTTDHHELLARNDVDAVVIATPDHWHVPCTIDACAAGKDVYVEKPLVHDVAEAQPVIDAQNNHKRIVQVGMQQRSMPHIIKARRLVRDGLIGPVHKARMTWNRNFLPYRKGEYRITEDQVDWKRFLGNAPDQPFDPFRMREWRWFWDFGAGILTDLMVHWLDTANMVLDLPADDPAGMPSRLVTLGKNIATAGVWETPDTINTVWDYDQRQMQLQFDGTFVTANDGAMLQLMGEDATLYIDRGRYELRPQRFREVQAQQWILGSGPPGQDFYDEPDGELLHMSNWLECIRTRNKPNAPAEAGVQAAVAAHLGNKAYREKRVVNVDLDEVSQWRISRIDGRIAQFRPDPDSPWAAATVGQVMTPTGEFRTGPRTRLELCHISGRTVTFDRLGMYVAADAVRHWRTNGQEPRAPGMRYGRTSVQIDAQRLEYETPITDPNKVLSIR